MVAVVQTYFSSVLREVIDPTGLDLVLSIKSKDAFTAEESRFAGGVTKVAQLQSKGRSLLKLTLRFEGTGAVEWLKGDGERDRELSAMEPLELAQHIIARNPSLLVLDLRGPGAEKPIPGALLVAADTSALSVLADAVPGRTTVVVYDSVGTRRTLPGVWPAALQYRYVNGGRAGGQREVLTPATPTRTTLAERERIARQHQLAAFFSGATVQASGSAPPPRVAGPGGAKKKKGGGC